MNHVEEINTLKKPCILIADIRLYLTLNELLNLYSHFKNFHFKTWTVIKKSGEVTVDICQN